MRDRLDPIVVVLKFFIGPVRDRTLSLIVDFELIERGLSEVVILELFVLSPPVACNWLALKFISSTNY